MTNNTESKIEVIPDFSNPIFRLENLYLIKTKDATIGKLKLNQVQKILLSHIEDAVKFNKAVREHVLKYRQGGVSTFFLLLHLDRTIFTANITTGILADLRENLKYLFEIVRFAHDTMPDDIRPRVSYDSVSELGFPDSNSKIMVSLEIKSTTLNGLHVSEYAYMKQQEVERTLAACTPDAWVTTETTANGKNFYEKKWRSIRDEPKIFLPWPLQEEYRIPKLGVDDTGFPPLIITPEEQALSDRMLKDYGLAMDDRQFRFRRKKKQDHGSLFLQEMAEDSETCFLSSEGQFFHGKKINILIKEAEEINDKEPPEKKIDYEIWEPRQHRHLYVAGADIAEGGAGDYSVLAILCTTCRQTAFRYKARCKLDTFARICNHWCSHYNNALLAPEANAMGQAVIELLREYNYKNLYSRNRNTRNFEPKVILKYGWKTDTNTRAIMLSDLKASLEGDSEDDEDHFEPLIRWRDTEFLNETFNIAEVKGKIQAVDGEHDDMTFAYGIAVQMYNHIRQNSASKILGGIITGAPLESDREFRY